MKMTNKTIKQTTSKIVLIAIAIISLSPVFMATEAHAGMTDPYVVNQLQDSRSQLLRKETQLLRDQDDLKRQLDDMKRRNDGNVLASSINDLTRRLDKTYSDLRQTQTAIRDVEHIML